MNQIIVIPAYNEADNIAQVLRAVREVASDFDVVVVNDGSTDSTAQVVRALGVPQLVLPCNLGYARALQTGLRFAVQRGYQTIVFMDADGQHDPRDVRRLADRVRESGADLVIGSRFAGDAPRRYAAPLGRRIGIFFFSLMTWLFSGSRIYDTTSGFKAMRARAARALLRARFVDFHAEVLVYLALQGYRIVEVPVEVKERTAGISMHSALSLLTYPLQTMLLVALAVLQARLPAFRKDVP